MAPIFPEDRKRYPQLSKGRQAPREATSSDTDGDTDSSVSDTRSNDSVPVNLPVDYIPGLGVPGTSRDRVWDAVNIVNRRDYRVTMSQIGFKRQNRFRYEDHQFR